ncbi:MAG: hypothetical protein E6H67_11850 [Betaproteobacteria bacterium]|nr:MAG: hypothetical protein E6H67_11850 [Betaproteobacteria bacterium]
MLDGGGELQRTPLFAARRPILVGQSGNACSELCFDLFLERWSTGRPHSFAKRIGGPDELECA